MSLFTEEEIIKKVSDKCRKYCPECEYVEVGDSLINHMDENSTLADYKDMYNKLKITKCYVCDRNSNKRRDK